MRIRFLVYLSLFLCRPLMAQVVPEKDTTRMFTIDTVRIREIIVPPIIPAINVISVVYNGEYALRPDLNGNGASLRAMLSPLPGIRFEERGWGGSRRLSIRGSLRRADFGIRNIKFLDQSVPLTSADGSTPMELIDPDIPAEWSIQKGGTDDATGGRILLHAHHYSDSSYYAEAFATAGTYGLRRAGIRLSGHNERSHSQLSYTRQTSQGYRQQEASQKHVLYASHEVQLADHLSLYGNIKAFSGGWELPGSLDRLAMLANRTQAVPYSVWADAGLHKQTARAQIGIVGRPGRHFRLYRLGISGLGSQKLNPYGTSPGFQGYKSEMQLGMSAQGQVEFEFRTRNNILIAPDLSVEYQQDHFDLLEYDNAGGIRGALKSSGQLRFSRAMIKPTLSLHDSNRGSLRLQGALLYYGFQQTEAYPESGTFESNGQWKIMPGIRYSKWLRRKWSLRLDANRSVSWPTHWEMQYGGNTGELQPEQAYLFEASFLRDGILAKVDFPEGASAGHTAIINLYAQLFSNAILPLTDADGTPRYYNAGRLNQFGAEAHAWFKPWRLSRTSRIRFHGSAGIFRYVFGEYDTDNGNLKGKYLPGWPLFSLGLDGKYVLDSRISIEWSNFLSGPTFLDNANTDRMLPYLRGDLSVRYRINVLKGEMVLLEAGVNNLYNVRYPSYLTLNAFGDRYYNPAPTRGVFAGLRFVWDRNRVENHR